MAQNRRASLVRSTTLHVLLRTVFRLIVFASAAPFGKHGSATTFVSLLCLSAVFCVVAGAMRHEAIFGDALTHWDEAAIYGFIGHLVIELS